MTKVTVGLLLILCSVSLAAQDRFRVYLMGDAGLETVNTASYKKILQQQLNDSIPSAIVFLGDNIYPKGMPEAGHRKRHEAERVLEASLSLAPGFKGPVIFIPGNHDWKQGRPAGLNYLANQQAWLDSLHQSNITLLPKDGCPGPVEVPLGDHALLIVIDTQWWLHPWEKPEGETSGCDCKTQSDLIVQLNDALRRNTSKRVIVAAHHPLITYGEHGGVFSWKEHIFPLTDINKKLYVPLPVIGSIYPVYRKVFGHNQDIAHPEYRKMNEQLTALLKQYPGVVYASGHDHSLQYLEKDSIHYVISGGASKSGTAKKKKYSLFAAEELGYVSIDIHANTQTNIQYITTDKIGFERSLKALASEKRDSASTTLLHQGSIKVHASDQYAANKRQEKWFGKNYRSAWSQEITVPVFDIGKEQGGLKILQRGGGNQTISLRVADSTGREYSLRSIEKFPEKAMPEPLRKTFAKDIVQDKISAAHPYGAVVIPSLAQGAGIYHTNPKIVFVPDDPRLGIYRNDVANQLMLFEERPDGSGKDLDFFGNADKMVSTTKLLEQLAKDNDNSVDERFFLRSRLFDMWIGDWDRHEDQWRWAEFDSKKGKLFRPIPRDRDQAFFVNEGHIPQLLGKKWFLFQFEGFNNTVRWPSGLMFSGRHVDRNFLATLSREDWIAVADELTKTLTDSLIDTSLKQWPEEIYNLQGEEIASKLKSRRETLQADALQHYEFLAREVSLKGSDKREHFEISRMPNGDVDVKVFKLNKESEKGKLLYERLFLAGETKEIRIYGMDGDDQFVLSGNSNRHAVKVRIIGGAGHDAVEAGKDKATVIYDKKTGMDFSAGAKLKDHTSNDKLVNDYNWRDYTYNRTVPLVYANYNIDDGIFIGGGFRMTKEGFRKDPFKSKHLFLASYAPHTNSFNFRYDGRFTDIIGKWSGEIDADVKAPNYVNNFFGWGNESEFDRDIDDTRNLRRSIDYYRVRFNEVRLDLKMSRRIGKTGFVKIGPTFQRIDIESFDDNAPHNRYITDVYLPAYPGRQEERHYVGLISSWGIDNRNHPLLTTRGVYFEQTSRALHGIDTDNLTAHNASLAIYQAFKIPAIVTFAVRAGAGVNTGKYEFYQAQVLDGKTELRGFRKTRFYGDKKVYFNNEVRIKLTSFQSYVFPAHLGLLAFYDVGRVWYKDPVTGNDPSTASGTSNVWHHGFGGGVWLTPFNFTVVSVEVGGSGEGAVLYVSDPVI